MSSKQFSPAARLLRQSRLMAMPAPVPPPPTHNIHNPPPSPYPTVQAITTAQTSAVRGEWGLKRDLPQQTSTKKQFLRYNDLDTWMHMTTVESAHDDVYTVKKWQEMDIPLLEDNKSMIDYVSRNGKSVFSEGEKPEGFKWRYSGPYLPDLTDGELKEYIEKKVTPREGEFLEYIVNDKKQERLEKLRARNASEQELKKAEEETVEVDVLALRGDWDYLERMALQFLDIPTETRPYRTQPSAGLHYIRSDAAVTNDPELGPLERRKPIPGRALNSTHHGGVAGVGGVVAKVISANFMPGGGLRNKNLDDREKINKYYPDFAKISPGGRIELEVAQVDSGSQGTAASSYPRISRRFSAGKPGEKLTGDNPWGAFYKNRDESPSPSMKDALGGILSDVVATSREKSR